MMHRISKFTSGGQLDWSWDETETEVSTLVDVLRDDLDRFPDSHVAYIEIRYKDGSGFRIERYSTMSSRNEMQKG